MTKFTNPTKVITGPNTRFSYANVWEAKSINGGAPKFSVSLIIPKSDTKTVEKIKAAIEAAGGVEAVVNSAMEQIEGKTPDELKAMFVEQLKASNISEEQINLIMQQYDSESGEGSFTADTYKQIMTDILNTLQSAEGAGSFIEAILMNCDEDTLKQLSEAFDAYEAGEVEDDKTGEGETTGEATGGDNADTGVEGVAAVVGVIAVAGAVVVISRKRA